MGLCTQSLTFWRFRPSDNPTSKPVVNLALSGRKPPAKPWSGAVLCASHFENRDCFPVGAVILHHPNFQPAESTDSTGFLFPVQVPMGQRVAWALLRLFATPGDVSLATFAAGRPEISAAVSVPDGRSPRFYAILSLGIFPRINASLFASRVPVAGLCLAVLRRTPRSRKLLSAETNLRFEYQPVTTG